MATPAGAWAAILARNGKEVGARVLAVFGFGKGHFTGVPKMKAALQTTLVGSLAAGVAYVIAKFIA